MDEDEGEEIPEHVLDNEANGNGALDYGESVDFADEY